MVNRAGCGQPEGYPWKRIDYVWVRGFRPVAMTRFGVRPPGEAGLSDHLGIVATIAEPASLQTASRGSLPGTGIAQADSR